MDTTTAPPLGDENRQPGIIVMAIVLTVLADLVVGLRMIVRKWVVRNIGWDDWTIVAAVLGITVGMALVIVEVHYGFGRHKYYLSQHEFKQFQKYSYGEWIQTFATLMFTKVSICLLILPESTGALCIARTVLNWQNVTDDPTWISIDNWYLRSWEVCIGIIAASVPTLRPGYIYLRSRLQKSKPESSVPSSQTAVVPSVCHHPNAAKASQPSDSHQTTNSTLTDETFFLPLQNFEMRTPTRLDVEMDHNWRRISEDNEYKGQVSRNKF
ncbi:hypothetical protein MMC16_007340 [Acarospora aff. strigata]|nr:hypothetical protein [Acarospora aff. strigata]